MSVGQIGGSGALFQGFIDSGMSLNKYAASLIDDMKSATSSSNINSSFNEALFQRLGSVSTDAATLRAQISAMSSMTKMSSNVGREAMYSNNDVLSANVGKGATVGNYTRTDVNVTQLAGSQQNRSDALRADENSFGSSFEFNVTDNEGNTTTFRVDLAEEDTNKSAMQEMVDRINESDTGLRATLEVDQDAGTVRMSLTSDRTGETDGRFTVSDNSGANLANVERASQNAQFTVNGQERSSQTNDVTIQSGVTATLNSEGSTQITYQADVGQALNSVQQFVDTFNSLRDSASGSQALANQLSNLMNSNSRSLSQVGISMNSDGRMTISDSNNLSTAISDGSFARNFQGINSFGNNLNDIARNAYRTAYNSAVQDNFRELMDRVTTNDNWQTGSTSFSGLLFNMWA